MLKTELVSRRGPWRTVDQVEAATLHWVDWFNHHRLPEVNGDLPPVELEQAHYRQHAGLAEPGYQGPTTWTDLAGWEQHHQLLTPSELDIAPLTRRDRLLLDVHRRSPTIPGPRAQLGAARGDGSSSGRA